MRAIFQPLAMAAALGLSGLGAESPADRARSAKPQSEEIEDSTTSPTYPLKMIGRAGVSVAKTPIILGETVAGERRFVSERGFFTPVEETKAGREKMR